MDTKRNESAVLRWGFGPWMHESDHEQWEAHGLRCEMRRHSQLGHWCGYVFVPEGHPWHGADDMTISADVHGGVTWAAKEDDGTFKIGFDCAHLGDLSPSDLRNSGPRHIGARYRDAAWVKRETESLARQAAEASR